ncbi:ABC transporter permease [Sphingomonas sp. NSE70-1]|uniref:ABC transporter permease n=1 Tax=Sphingomonas caseinilyticus TaxID=2908205 RepID=A0ABT0RQN7_9SPHN|nr:ABC transporter permease [Sphingomonas caseinilyticus]MCL6697309.1 ABC transporter permease [Sphingomonas caseinilyticus]
MPNNEQTADPGVRVDGRSWTIQRRVLGALLLRELLTRYGRNNIGFLWLFVEPMLFTLVITAFWTATRQIHGSNIPIVAFAVTGYSSLLLWRNLPSRCIGALKANIALLFHRQVSILDVYIARIFLEMVGATTSLVVLSMVFTLMGWMPAPEDVLEVIFGWTLLAWFGTGLAMTVGGLSEKFDVFGRLWPPFSYIMFPLSGVAFIADALPPNFREIVLWLPQLNALEIMREGWFGSLMRAHYDLGYLCICNLLLTFSGLSLIRQIGLDAREE